MAVLGRPESVCTSKCQKIQFIFIRKKILIPSCNTLETPWNKILKFLDYKSLSLQEDNRNIIQQKNTR
jgi:hypothetical protein